MKGQKPRAATLIQTLVFYIEPQLLLLQSEKARNVFAVAVPMKDMHHPFFAVEVRENTYNKYFDGKADLNYVFRNAAYDKYYLFDLSDVENNTVEMSLINKEFAEKNRFFPDVGAFARSHTHSFNKRNLEGVIVHKFNIDGNWQANDFSYFHAKLANLYSLFSVLRRLEVDHLGAPERAFIRGLIRDRYWRGGGSYLGFYDELYDHIRTLNPLEVESIVYQSPGQISFKGDGTAFAEIDQIIEVFSTAHEQLKQRYLVVHGILRQERLLREGPRGTFSTPEVARYARGEALALAKDMRLERARDILSACANNTVIFAKVILSIYRRANELYNFHAEGRVQPDD